MTKAEEASVKKMAKRVVKQTAAGPRVKNARTALALATQNANRHDRRTFIMASAAKLFAAGGYAATTMDDLSALTKLNKGTVYYYYKSKANILYDISASAATSLLNSMLPAIKMDKAVDGMTHIISVMIRWVIQNRVFTQVYYQETRYFESVFSKAEYKVIREQQRQMTKIVHEVLNRGCASGEFRPLDVTSTGRFIIGLMQGMYRWPEHEIDVDSMIASASDFVLRAVRR